MANFLVIYTRKPKHTSRTIYNGVDALKILTKFHLDDLKTIRDTGRCVTRYNFKISLSDHRYIPAGMELSVHTNNTDDIDKLIETAEKKQEKTDKKHAEEKENLNKETASDTAE